MRYMGFKDVKGQVIRCLESGSVIHDARGNIDDKNELSTGYVSIDEVISVLKVSRGNEYSSSPHHLCRDIEVHIITKTFKGRNWYIKWYYVEPNCIFISVHE